MLYCELIIVCFVAFSICFFDNSFISFCLKNALFYVLISNIHKPSYYFILSYRLILFLIAFIVILYVNGLLLMTLLFFSFFYDFSSWCIVNFFRSFFFFFFCGCDVLFILTLIDQSLHSLLEIITCILKICCCCYYTKRVKHVNKSINSDLASFVCCLYI